MWEVEVICGQCDEKHLVHSAAKGKPRAFSFVCPTTGEPVAMRYRDPSAISRPWTEVDAPSEGSIPVEFADVGGSLDI